MNYSRWITIAGLSCLFLNCAGANASTSDELAMIRKLIPSGYDIAQTQTLGLQGVPADEIEKTATQNYLLHDCNGDGTPDLIVIIEKNPTFRTADGQSCSAYDPEKNCWIDFGARTLQIYTGQKDGGFRLLGSSDKIVLNGDEGGVFGDPLDGLSLNKKGSVLLVFYGGSSWRWTHVDTLRYLKNDFYVVGQTDSSLHDTAPETTNSGKDVNLLTGEVRTYEPSGRPLKTKIPVKPLVRFEDFTSPMKN